MNWKHFVFDLCSVFIGVWLAFSLNHWNDSRKDRHSELKTLGEIKNGLAMDLKDIEENVQGHQQGIKACSFMRRVFREQSVPNDSFTIYYFAMLRDFISIQNKSGYESLKSKGLETISDDSLRVKIIALYDYHFQVIEKLEERYSEMQFYENYRQEIESPLASRMKFNDGGIPIGLDSPIDFTPQERKKALAALWRITYNRFYTIQHYQKLKESITEVIDLIDDELDES